MLGFAEDPWVLHGGASDHDSIDISGFSSEFDVCTGCDVAISNDGEVSYLGALLDDVPVG